MDRRNIAVDEACYRNGSWFGILTTISKSDDDYLNLMKREKLEKQWESLCHEEMKEWGACGMILKHCKEEKLQVKKIRL